ncbi:MAG: alanine racemase [Nitrospinae bacterium]|nr:alanine racemase [Nitrospinota bacterium]
MPNKPVIRPAALRLAAAKVPTPFYLYDAEVIRARYTALREALPEGWRLFYAAKANPNVAVLEVYRALGAVAECASAGEMLACLKAGFKGSGMALSGPVKGEQELAVIKKNPPYMIHAETETELAALNALGKKLNVALRLNLDLHLAHESAGRIMTGGRDKFGFSPEDAERIVAERGKYKNLAITGFHIYMGTQVRTPQTWLKGGEGFVRHVAEVCRKYSFHPIYLNFGGGLGIPYKSGDVEFDLARFKSGLAKLDRLIAREIGNVRCHIEPGRYLMGPAGVYVTKVVALKKMRGTNFALTDGGIHHALLPFRVSREFPAVLVRGRGGRKERYVIGGPLCTTLDQSDLPLELPRLAVGDVIAILNSGAYGYGTGMHFFLSHPLPAEVLADGKKLFIIRDASLSGHLFRYQVKRKI